MTKEQQQVPDSDPTAASRKQDHIELAFRSRVGAAELDGRFYYEPMLAPHPKPGPLPPMPFLGKILRAPIWVSSMTGGTALAGKINRNLATACAEFGLGMGLGSCRQLLYSDEHLADFNVRDIMGNELPLFANLGAAQLEKLIADKELDRVPDLLHRLRADGLIIHVNPLQEAMQPEGDVFERAPLDLIQEMLQRADYPIIVKEVGQGFGPESMRALLKLPLAAVEFAAAGGTNFAKLELLRSSPSAQEVFEKIAAVGHSAAEMLHWANAVKQELQDGCLTQGLIVSGGVSDFLDGYYLTQKASIPAVYGQASAFLKHAQRDYSELRSYISAQIAGLKLATQFLRVKQ
jgi:isopentenyl-diphosphate delta-isomerase